MKTLKLLCSNLFQKCYNNRFTYFTLLFVLLISGCSKDKYKVVIDNPTTAEIWVEIGSDRYDLQPNSSIELNLAEGPYKVYSGEVENSKTILNGDSCYIQSEGLLNASLSEYVVWRTIYLKSSSHSEWMHVRLKDTSVVLGEYAYKADLKVFNQNNVFIPIQWDFWLDQQIPLTWNGMGPGKRVSKLYRKVQFEQIFRRFAR